MAIPDPFINNHDDLIGVIRLIPVPDTRFGAVFLSVFIQTIIQVHPVLHVRFAPVSVRRRSQTSGTAVPIDRIRAQHVLKPG